MAGAAASNDPEMAPLSLASLKTCLAIAGSVMAVAMLAAVFDWHALLSSAARMTPSTLLGSGLLCGVTSLILALRWAMIATPAAAPLQSVEMLVALQAAIFSLITPAAIGGDVFRVTSGAGQRIRRLGLVLVERLFGVWAQSCVYAIAVLLAPWPVPPVLSRAGWIFTPLAAGGVVVILAMPRLRVSDSGRLLRGRVADLTAALTGHSTGKRVALASLSFAGVLSWVAASYTMARGGGMPLTLAQVATITIVTEFARLLPVAVQGIGVREAVFAWLSHLLGASAEEGFVVCALVYGVNAVVIGGLGCAASVVLPRLRSGGQALRMGEV